MKHDAVTRVAGRRRSRKAPTGAAAKASLTLLTPTGTPLRVFGSSSGSRSWIGLVILHVVDLDEQVLLVRLAHSFMSALPSPFVLTWTQSFKRSAGGDRVDDAGEVDTVRLPAVRESVAVRVDDLSGDRVETARPGNRAGLDRNRTPGSSESRGQREIRYFWSTLE